MRKILLALAVLALGLGPTLAVADLGSALAAPPKDNPSDNDKGGGNDPPKGGGQQGPKGPSGPEGNSGP